MSEGLTLKGHAAYDVLAASFTADGTRVLTGSFDGAVKVWDARPFRDTRPPEPAPEAAPPRGKK